MKKAFFFIMFSLLVFALFATGQKEAGTVHLLYTAHAKKSI